MLLFTLGGMLRCRSCWKFSLDVSVRCKSKHGFGVGTFSFSNEIIKLDKVKHDVIGDENIKPSRKIKNKEYKVLVEEVVEIE